MTKFKAGGLCNGTVDMFYNASQLAFRLRVRVSGALSYQFEHAPAPLDKTPFLQPQWRERAAPPRAAQPADNTSIIHSPLPRSLLYHNILVFMSIMMIA